MSAVNYASSSNERIVNYEQARTIHDEKHKNYFDKLQQEMQRKRTAAINSLPTIPKYTQRGDINHEPRRKTCDPNNFHSQALNHSVIPRHDRI